MKKFETKLPEGKPLRTWKYPKGKLHLYNENKFKGAFTSLFGTYWYYIVTNEGKIIACGNSEKAAKKRAQEL